MQLLLAVFLLLLTKYDNKRIILVRSAVRVVVGKGGLQTMEVRVAADLQFFFRAKEAKVFRHLDSERVAQINKELGGRDMAVVLCGDCRHSRDKLTTLFSVFKGTEPHVLAFNGGGITLDGLSPSNNGAFNSAPFTQFQVLQSLAVKGEICQVFLEAHFPCAVAGRAQMTIMDQVRSLITAKRHLKERIGPRTPEVKIGLLYHLYDDSASVAECRRMYYFDDLQMEEFMLQQRALLMTA